MNENTTQESIPKAMQLEEIINYGMTKNWTLNPRMYLDYFNGRIYVDFHECRSGITMELKLVNKNKEIMAEYITRNEHLDFWKYVSDNLYGQEKLVNTVRTYRLKRECVDEPLAQKEPLVPPPDWLKYYKN